MAAMGHTVALGNAQDYWDVIVVQRLLSPPLLLINLLKLYLSKQSQQVSLSRAQPKAICALRQYSY